MSLVKGKVSSRETSRTREGGEESYRCYYRLPGSERDETKERENPRASQARDYPSGMVNDP